MEINKVVNHTPHNLKRRIIKKFIRNNCASLFGPEPKQYKVRTFHLMIDEIKRFDRVAAAKLEKMMRVKNRDSVFCYCDNLGGCFKWFQTEDGYNYWEAIYFKLRKQRDQDFNKVMKEIELF